MKGKVMKRTFQISTAIICVVVLSFALYAHPGRTDSQGGHTNHKTGEYHYHNSGSSSSSKPETTNYPNYSKPKTTNSTSSYYSYYSKPKTTATSTSSNKPARPINITENHWQVALNNKVYHGKLEVPVSTGRVDIVTDTQVIEVDKVSKYQEGIEQALKYAQATGKQPVLALYIDGEPDGLELLKQADALCKEKNVSLLLINCYVSVNDFIDMMSKAGKLDNIVESMSLPINQTTDDPNLTSNTTNSQDSELNCWITNSSGVRHNSSCRYYMNSNGRKCSNNEGRACKICGG